ncbi:MAG: hypothetical protein ACKOPS_06460, partial [Cyanobium sp.]
LAALLLLRCAFAQAPGPRDPLQLLPSPAAARPLTLRGQLQADLRAGATPCRGVLLLEPGGVAEGATALRFSPCPALQEGWRLEVSGSLRRPRSAQKRLRVAMISWKCTVLKGFRWGGQKRRHGPASADSAQQGEAAGKAAPIPRRDRGSQRKPGCSPGRPLRRPPACARAA